MGTLATVEKTGRCTCVLGSFHFVASDSLVTIREFTADDGKQFIYRKFIAPSKGTVSFAKALNRSVTGSMNDHIHAARFMLQDDMAPSDIGYCLKETPMSALEGPDGRRYPRDVFANVVDRMGNE